MEREQLEFQISQYADGTLPAEDVAALEAVLASDAEARALLEDFRKIETSIKRETALPAMDWDRLRKRISNAVAAEDDRASRVYRIGATLDLSESRVSQMHSSIVARLQNQLCKRRPEFSN